MCKVFAVAAVLALCASAARAEVGIASFYGGRDHGGPTIRRCRSAPGSGCA